MNGAIKVILIVLGVLLLIPLIGWVFRVLFGLIMGLVGLVLGLLAIPFSLAAGLIGLVVGLVVLAVPIIIFLGVVGLAVWVVKEAFAGRSKPPSPPGGSDRETMEEIHRGLAGMEKRLDSLETILMDKWKR